MKQVLAVFALAQSCATANAREPVAPAKISRPTAPVSCPAGTVRRGKTPPEGNRMWCDTPDGVSHGPFIAWYGEGQKKTVGAFKDGKAHGVWKHWYRSGGLRSEGEYSEGLRVGEWQQFDEGGATARADTPKSDPPPQPRETKREIVYDEKRPYPRIGVAACDDYVDFFSHCVHTKAPHSTQNDLLDALERTVKGWSQVAQGPGKDVLAETCKQALKAVKKTTAAWGC